MIYSIITLLVFSIGFQFKSNINKSHIEVYYIIFLALFLFSAFRYEVGCDWLSYQNMYDKAKVLEMKWSFLKNNRDPLFWIMLRLISKMNLSYPAVNIVSSAIFFLGVNVLARRQPNPLTFLVLIFPILIINMPMSGIRQGISIGIICIAIAAIIDKRPLYFLLCVLLATGFHTSAIVFLVLLPFASGKYNSLRYLIAGLIAIIVLFFLTTSASGEHASSVYIGGIRQAHGAVYRVGMLALTGLYFFLFFKKKWQQTFPKDYDIIKLAAFGMILLMFIVPLSTIISDRYGYYLIPFQAIIFARLPYMQFKFDYLLHCTLPYIGLFLAFIIWTQKSWHFNKCYLPYDNWIFGIPSVFIQ